MRLVPLDPAHRDALLAAARDPEVGRYLLERPGTTIADTERRIARLLERQANGSDLPFTILQASDRRAVGMTGYLSIDRPDDAVEIGGTWLDRRFWRTPFNTEAKYLLLRHAFETEGAHRVFFKTDARNERSQRAIARIGAIREAVMREHIRLENGHYRSSVFYSLLAPEWPSVKAELETKLERPWSATPTPD